MAKGFVQWLCVHHNRCAWNEYEHTRQGTHLPMPPSPLGGASLTATHTPAHMPIVKPQQKIVNNTQNLSKRKWILHSTQIAELNSFVYFWSRSSPFFSFFFAVAVFEVLFIAGACALCIYSLRFTNKCFTLCWNRWVLFVCWCYTLLMLMPIFFVPSCQR